MHYPQLLTWLTDIRTIIFILSLILLKCILDRHSRDPRWMKLSKEMPGPTVYPVVGTNLALLLGARDGFGKLFVNFMKTYGPTFRFWIGGQLAVMVSDVNDVQTVLTNSKCLEKFGAIHFKTLFGNSLGLASPVAVWKHKRKELQPFFIKNNLLDKIQEINELTDKYIEKMKKELDGPEFDLRDYMNQLAFATIMKTHLNYEISDQERDELNILVCQKLNESLIKITFNWFFRLPFLKIIINWIQPVDIIETKEMMRCFINKVLNSQQKSSYWAEEEEEFSTQRLQKENFVQSFIRMLLKMETELGEEDLVHFELNALILAAVETSGNTMAFVLHALAAHPDIQEKVYQEICQVLGEDRESLEASDLNKFPYLEQVIKETQRLFTVFPNMMRNVEKDVKIGSRIYPAGTLIMVNTSGIHHNPEIYPHPYRFNPDNFAPEAIKNRHQYSFIPFSGGPRNCVGKEFAQMSMKLRLVSLLRIFKFETHVKLEDIKLKAGILESSANGNFVSIKLRKSGSLE